VLGILLEGVVQTVVEQIPAERQAKAAATLFELLIERSAASGVPAKIRRSPPDGDLFVCHPTEMPWSPHLFGIM
jgi:hypothetical protein